MSLSNAMPTTQSTLIPGSTVDNSPPADTPTHLSSRPSPGTNHKQSTIVGIKRNLTCAGCFKDARDLGSNTTSKLKHCARCKEVVYCGRECQVGDWATHKSSCGKVSFRCPENINIAHRFQLWSELHNLNITHATYAAMCLSQPTNRIKGFDIAAHCMWYQITQRDDHDGNPAKMFRVDAGKLRSREWMFEVESFDDSAENHHQQNDRKVAQDQASSLEGDEREREDVEEKGPGGIERATITQSRPEKQWGSVRDSVLSSIPHHIAQYRKSLDPSMHETFIGVIPVCYSVVIPGCSTKMNFIGLSCIIDHRVIFFDVPEMLTLIDGSRIPPPRHELWLERLKNRVELGHVFGTKRSLWTTTLKAGLGEMKKTRPEGGKYRWFPLTREENRRHGYRFMVCGLNY